MTVFYKGKLKRTRKPEDVFAKIKACVKPKGVTKSWSIKEGENYLRIDFGDEKSETLNLCFKDKTLDGFCKVAFDGDGGEKQLDEFFNLFYSITKMFSSLEINDDFGLWEDFADSKRYKTQIRELTKSETARIKRLYDGGCIFHEDIIMAVIAEDLNITTFSDIDFSLNTMLEGVEMEEIKIIEAWLLQTAVYKDRGRIEKYTIWRCNPGGHKWRGYGWKDDYNEVSELEFAVWACVFGIAGLFIEKFAEHYPHLAKSGGAFPKDVQVKRLFKEKFLPLFNAEDDTYNQCILAYRFMVSIYEYCGFKYEGKE